jgi:hypothetical protein
MPDFHVLLRHLQRENATLRAEVDRLKVTLSAQDIFLATAWRQAAVRRPQRGNPPERPS